MIKQLLNKLLIAILILLSLFTGLNLKAELPDRPVIPLPAEILTGNKGYALQTIIDKDFSHGSRFNFFSVTSFSADYHNHIKLNQDFVNNTSVGFELFDWIDVAVGVSVNTKSGSNFNIGLEYNYDVKDFVLVISPNIDLSVNHNLDVVAVAEYSPKLKKGGNWGIYAKILSLYDYNTKQKMHDRSYLYLRLGPSYKNVSFGLGANFDRYGIGEEFESTKKNNYGFFVRYTFI